MWRIHNCPEWSVLLSTIRKYFVYSAIFALFIVIFDITTRTKVTITSSKHSLLALCKLYVIYIICILILWTCYKDVGYTLHPYMIQYSLFTDWFCKYCVQTRAIVQTFAIAYMLWKEGYAIPIPLKFFIN